MPAPETPPAGTPIPSATDKKGMDNPQIQTSVKPDDSPIKDSSTVLIMQGEQQPPLESEKIAAAAQTPEERAKKKARLATLLDRGIVSDRLTVELPPDLHGEWVRNDPLDIHRLEVLGFQIDHEFAPRRAIHNDGTGAAVVGDVIFMTTSRENKELIDEIRHEQFLANNNPRKSKEEVDFENNIRSQGGDVPVFTESKQRVVRKEQIADVLREVDKQTTPVTTR